MLKFAYYTRVLCLAAVTVMGAGCQSDGSPAEGSPGAHIWFESSVQLDLERIEVFDGPGVAPPGTCGAWSFPRAALTDAQLAAVEAVTLRSFPTSNACEADGYTYTDATVTDTDGTTATYRDTGCPYLRIAGSSAMLPPGFFGSTFPLGASQPCP